MILSPDYVLGHRHPYVGINELGEPILYDRSYAPHLLISGQSGSGKGGLQKLLLVQDLVAGHTVYVIAPDPGEFGWIDGHATLVDEDGVPDLLGEAVDQMDQRQRQLRQAINPQTGKPGVARVDLLEQPPPKVVLYADEAPAFLGDEARLSYDNQTAKQITHRTGRIAKRGRKYGVHLVVATQYPTIGGTFGSNDQGGGIRNQLVGRIHCDRNSESMYAMFDSGSRPNQATIDYLSSGLEGRMVYSKLNRKERDGVIAGQIHWLEDAEALALVEGSAR